MALSAAAKTLAPTSALATAPTAAGARGTTAMTTRVAQTQSRDLGSTAGSSCANPPPEFLTREEACCLKTALALIITKRRLEERMKKQQQQQDDDNDDTRMDATDTAYAGEDEDGPERFPINHWMTHLPNSLNDNNRDKNMESLLYGGGLPATSKEWAHLDHMMQLAGQALQQQHQQHTNTQNSTSDWEPRFRALTTHLSHRLKCLDQNEVMKQWLQSYLFSLTPTSVAIFRAILHQTNKNNGLASVMLEMLTKMVQSFLLVTTQEEYTNHHPDDSATRTATVIMTADESFHLLSLMESCFLLVPEQTARQYLEEELQDLTLPLADDDDDLALCYVRYCNNSHSQDTHHASTRLYLRMAILDLLQEVIVALSVPVPPGTAASDHHPATGVRAATSSGLDEYHDMIWSRHP